MRVVVAAICGVYSIILSPLLRLGIIYCDLFSPHQIRHFNISHIRHKERISEQQHSSVLTTMSAPSSPDGGNGEENDAAAVGMNFNRRSVDSTIHVRVFGIVLIITSSFASSSTFGGTSPSFLNASSSVGAHGGGNDSNDVGGGTSASASASATSASSARMEDIRRKYGTLLDALAAIAPTHARVLVENLVSWEKGVTEV